MPPSDRHQQPLRLPHDMAERLRRQAGRKKISLNTYVQLAIEERLEADEARQRERTEDRRGREKGREAPRGLGLRPLRQAEPAPLPAPAEGPAPVVVNVGSAAGPLGDGGLLEGLAAYILSGPSFSRDQRRRLACEVLRSHGKTSAERAALTEKLDQILAEQKEQQPARPLLGTIGSLFR